MKKMIYLAICFFLLSCSTKELQHVKIVYAKENIMRFVSIGCDDFEEAFHGETKEVFIDSDSILSKLSNSLKSYKTNASLEKIDVRAKVFLYYKDSTTQIICFDRFNNAAINGKFVILNNHFFEIIRNFTK
jgi:hypothetical protein